MSEVRDVLDFWYGQEFRPHWFARSPALDEQIRRRFGALVERAAQGQCAHWENSAEGALALLLCLDQFPRNMHRGTPRAFAADPLARAVSARALARGLDREFRNDDERIFFYLPLEHSENLDDQRRAVELVRSRTSEPVYLRFAIAHLEVIERFGRFPHRNAILGRPSTPEEEEYLAQPGSGF
jgi:uncharacterized protein (DUF924 family)